MTDDRTFVPLGAAKRELRDPADAECGALWNLSAKWHGGSGEDSWPASPRRTGAVPAVALSPLPSRARSPTRRRAPSTASASSAATPASTAPSSARGGPGRPSPGAALRAASAATSPAPHPLPELMRLTSARHLVPMTRVIHSMASLSRAGAERGQRKINQDAVFAYRQYVQPHQAIACVLDGHGPNGHAVSAFAKARLPVAVAEALRRAGEAAAGAALRAAFLEIQTALQAATGAVNARLSGSTAVVSLLQGRRLTTAWVGDSRAVLLRREVGGGWRGVPLTTDHKPTAAAELERILGAGGRVERLSDGAGREVGPHRVWLPGSWVPGLAMSRALGDLVAASVGVTAEPEVHCCELQAGDEYLVVASDGVWEFMTAQEVADVVGSGGAGAAEEACRAVVEAAAQRWGAQNEGVVDDISVVVARLLPPE